jgi:hypothetical protein
VELPRNARIDVTLDNAVVRTPHSCVGVLDTAAWTAAFSCKSGSGDAWAVNGDTEHHEGKEVIELYIWANARDRVGQPDIAIDLQRTSDSGRFAGWATVMTPQTPGSGVPGSVANAVVRR